MKLLSAFFAIFVIGLTIQNKKTNQELISASRELREAVDNMFKEFPGIGVGIDSSKSALTVTAVHTNTPAMKEGIKTGDEILKINGRAVESIQDMKSICAQNIGRHLELELRRGNQILHKKVMVVILKPKIVVEAKE